MGNACGTDGDLCSTQPEGNQPPNEVAPATQHRQDLLVVQMMAMRMSDIMEHAHACGIGAAEMDSAEHADNPKHVLVELIVKHEQRQSSAQLLQLPETVRGAYDSVRRSDADAERVAHTTSDFGHVDQRAVLEGMKLKALKRRARDVGVDEEQLEDVDDEDDVKASVIGLILGKLQQQAAGLLPDEQELRKELGAMKLKALKKRAKEIGVDGERLEDADDEDNVKSTVIELIITRMRHQGCTGSATSVAEFGLVQQQEKSQKLREELQALKLKALKKHAKEIGVDQDELDDADDAGDVKSTVIELVISREQARKSSTSTLLKSHQGGDSMVASRSRLKQLFHGKHCMLSYNWAEQEHVKLIRSQIAAVGCPTWMDVDGGMKSDIYDSMAEGVSNAACVVCFMSQAYQDSANCALELKFVSGKRLAFPAPSLRGIANDDGCFLSGKTVGCANRPGDDGGT